MSIQNQEKGLRGHQARKVGNYLIDLASEIGSGYTSKVYKAKNVLGGDELAMKVIDMKKISSEMHKLLLQNQLKALNQLNHPNILKSIEILKTSNNIYIATALYQQNMETYFATKGRLAEPEIIFFLTKMAEALCYLQLGGIIHRDVKLANIFLANGQYVLGDFGFCYFVGAPCSEQGYNIGSPLYMSPEAQKSVYSHQSDVWALGICILQLHLGYRPFIGMTFDQMFHQICQVKFYREFAISNLLKSILDSMFQFDASQRVTPLNLLQRVKAFGYVRQVTNHHTPNLRNFTSPSRNNFEQLKSSHKRSVSIRINQNSPKVNFRNVHKKRVSIKRENDEPQRKAMIAIQNRGASPISSRGLTQRQNYNSSLNCPRFLKSSRHSGKMRALRSLNEELICDPRLGESLNKIKLSVILSAAFQTPLNSQLSSKLFQHPPDFYLNYVLSSITSNSASLMQVMHFLIFLAESILREEIFFMNQIGGCTQSIIQRVNSLEDFIHSCLQKDIDKQNFHSKQLQSSTKALKSKSKSVGNLRSNLIFHKFQIRK